MPLKHPSADLKRMYPLCIEAGLIFALLIAILCLKIDLPDFKSSTLHVVESEETALILPPSISENTAVLKAPPKPRVPVFIPNDKTIEPEPLELTEYDRVSRLMIPPLPDEILIESNQHLFSDIQKLPELIGGDLALQNSIRYPEFARRIGAQGIVEVEFTVTETGKVLDPLIVKSLGYGCDEAVLKAIKVQRYKPGKKAGKVSSFRIKETVQFILLKT